MLRILIILIKVDCQPYYLLESITQQKDVRKSIVSEDLIRKILRFALRILTISHPLGSNESFIAQCFD